MPDKQLSYAEAEEILKKHEDRFSSIEGVLGVGLAIREGEMRFVIAVDDEQRVRPLITESTVEGYPVHIEKVTMVAVGNATNRVPPEAWADRSPKDDYRYDGLIPRLVRWLHHVRDRITTRAADGRPGR